MKAVLGIIVALAMCGQTMFAQGLTRDSRQADQEASYSGFAAGYVATNASWKINGTNFGMGQQMLLRNIENGRLWTTFFHADGRQAFDASNSITANAMSMMANVGLDTNDSALAWNVDAIGDTDGDGKDEAVLTKTSSGQLLKKVLFFADNGTVTRAGAQWQNGSQWVIEGIGLFDTNKYDTFKTSAKAKQILLRNNTNGRLWTTYLVDNGSTQHYATNDVSANAMSQLANIGLATNDAALNWTVAAIGDTDGDGKDEAILTKNDGAGQLLKKVLFFADNGTVKRAGAQWQNGSQWVIEGMGLFDTNKYDTFKTSVTAKQILLRNNTNGRLWTTYLVDNGSTQHYATNDVSANAMSQLANIGLATNDAALNWIVQGIGDVNNDGKDEVVLTKNDGAGQLLKKVLFYADNGTVRSAGPQWQNGTKWSIKGVSRSK